MDGGRYLGIPIPTIKHDNLNRYGRSLIADHESRRRLCTISYTKQLTYRPTLLYKKEEGKK